MERTKTFSNGSKLFPADVNLIEDRAAEMLEGTAAAIPSSHYAGRYYRATDTGDLYLDNGTIWEKIAGKESVGTEQLVPISKSIISTEQSRTNTAYGVLATPDEVTIILPTNGLIAIGYQATWASSVSNAAKAALFLGTNQLKVASNGSGLVPAVIAAQMSDAGFPNTFRPLVSSAQYGLLSPSATKTYGSDITTGQIIGSLGIEEWAYEFEGGTAFTKSPPGGFCSIFAAAGTYKISVQFKASSGSVTVKNRRLWVGITP